ncbi:MAG: hypothetical protein NVS2B8_18400 [Vulcanimicrobiaceae bacterium]
MRPLQPLPNVLIVTVLTDGGPYRSGDRCSLAFVEPTVGRLLSHVASTATIRHEAIVPESIRARIDVATDSADVGCEITLWFVDPTVARIERSVARVEPATSAASTARPIAAPGIATPDIAALGIAALDIAAHDVAAHDIANHIAARDVATHNIAARDIATHHIATHTIAAHTIAAHTIAAHTIAADDNTAHDSTALDMGTPDIGAHEIDTHDLGTHDVGTHGVATKDIATRDVSTRDTATQIAPTVASQASIDQHEPDSPTDVPDRVTLDEEAVLTIARRDQAVWHVASANASASRAIASEDHGAIVPERIDVSTVTQATAADNKLGRHPGASAAVPTQQRARSLAYAPGVEVRLEWTPERVRRFVTVVDKLFTVERLGWYRHVLAMRLLVPDRITCGDGPTDLEATRHLHALRAASVETLGKPLLGAFMPNFTVTPDWLESIDSAAAARALAGVRDAIEPFVTADGGALVASDEPRWTVGRIDRGDVDRAPGASVEAFMPLLVASVSEHAELTERFEAYRHSLIEVFAQTARSTEPVRLGAMTQPNHSLDDRLWHLVGTIGEIFGGLAVA